MPLTAWILLALALLAAGLLSALRNPLGRTSGTEDTAGGSPTPSPRPAKPPAPSNARARPALAAATSWGYQLQNLDIARAAASPFDLLVVDYAKDGADDTAITAAEMARLRTHPDGRRRLVVAYLSIGEAESYRSYWQSSWTRAKPDWLLGENPDWDENYAVCYWDTSWQRMMCGSPNSALDKIIAAGFDGVYLDKCDVFEDLRRHFRRAAQGRPDLEADMVAFIAALSAHAKARDPDFLVIMQNAETLLDRPALRRAIDAVAKEELVFGDDGPGRHNGAEDIAFTRAKLDLLAAEGKPVFVVEYLDAAVKITAAAAVASAAGYILYIAPKDRNLARLNYQVAQV